MSRPIVILLAFAVVLGTSIQAHSAIITQLTPSGTFLVVVDTSFPPNPFDWSQANNYAASNFSLQLASITSSAENSEIVSVLQSMSLPLSSAVWLGGVFANSNPTWVDGTSFTYTNWANGEPSISTNGTAIGMRASGPDVGKWFDDSPSATYDGLVVRMIPIPEPSNPVPALGPFAVALLGTLLGALGYRGLRA